MQESAPTRVAAVGPLAFGTAALAGHRQPVTEAMAIEAVNVAWRAGVRYFDTAPYYGSGLSERRLGLALASRQRDEYAISTKVGRLVDVGEDGTLSAHFDFSYDATMWSLEESLLRLGLDRIDIALVHDPDDHFLAARDGAFRALTRLRDEGVVSAIGGGMNQWQMLHRFVQELDLDYVMPAGRTSILDATAATELLPLCESKHVAVLAAGVFGTGILADPRPGARFNYAPASPEILAKARRIRDVCTRWNVGIGALAMHFPLLLPAVQSVVFGASTPPEVEQNTREFNGGVPDGVWIELTELGLLPDGIALERVALS